MKILLIIAWRNIWRHPARSGVLLAAIAAGLWAGIVTVGIMNGMMNQRVNYLIESEITHVQVHNPEYPDERSPSSKIYRFEEIVNWLDSDERVKSYSPRILADGMLQTPIKTSGVRIRGIETEREMQTTTFHRHMTEGVYLGDELRNPVIIGEKMAQENRLDIGNRIVLTFEDVDQQLVSAAFNITGFFKSASTDYDDTTVFVKAEDLSGLISSETIVHEIAILLNDAAFSDEIASELSIQFPESLSRTWQQLSPELSSIIELSGIMLYLVTLIILAALAFGILNTMLMALFERTRELGMLISIGMSRSRVFVMILLESIVLTLTGAFTGMLLALGSIHYLAKSGINFSMFADGIAELGWDQIVYPILTPTEYFTILILVILVSLFSSFYPALKAIRTNPLEASRRL